MKGKTEPAPALCAHFTGSYVGQCRAGVPYASVKDQSRREQLARFPCDRSLNSFTTCERADFTPVERPRRRIDVSEKNWRREIVYTPEKGAGLEPVRGVLVGCSDDQATAFIRHRPTPKRTRVTAAPVEQCHFARRKKEDDGSRENSMLQQPEDLPLFQMRESPVRDAPDVTRLQTRLRDEPRPARKVSKGSRAA
jgi:hypothetical protein